MAARDLVRRYRVAPGKAFRLAHVDPDDTAGIADKEQATERLADSAERIGDLQRRLYAQDRWAVLLIFQGMDASGKDGTVKHALSAVDPSGCQVHAFKAPSEEELDHDFLWRAARALPERGRIGVFNRSYYEELVTVRVHPEYLERQRLPEELAGAKLWDERAEGVVDYERYLARNGVLVRKFFLHVSKGEQRKRLLARMDEPEKNWKLREQDVTERRHWGDYQRYWGRVIAQTSSAHAPWFVVPANHKWFARLVVAEAVVQALEQLEPEFPHLDKARRAELDRARRLLRREGRR
jgi:PPK2 family polyphosphate:nucleotide phosphotransferase